MQNLKYQIAIAFSVLALMTMGCQQSPDADVQAARTAIAAAKKVGAGTKASQELVQATSLLDSALMEIEVQNKSFLNRDYTHAKQLLLASAENAQIAGMQSMASKPTVADSTPVPVAKPMPTQDTVVTLSPKSMGASKDSAEAIINQTYALYQKVSAQKKASPAKLAMIAEAMSQLKAAKVALKNADYPQVFLNATKADSLLKLE